MRLDSVSDISGLLIIIKVFFSSYLTPLSQKNSHHTRLTTVNKPSHLSSCYMSLSIVSQLSRKPCWDPSSYHLTSVPQKKLRHSSKSQSTDTIEPINCCKFWQYLRPTSNLRSGWNFTPGGRQLQRNHQHFGHHLRELWGLHFSRFLYPSLISTVKLPRFSSNLLQTRRRLASLGHGANLEVDWSSQAIC